MIIITIVFSCTFNRYVARVALLLNNCAANGKSTCTTSCVHVFVSYNVKVSYVEKNSGNNNETIDISLRGLILHYVNYVFCLILILCYFKNCIFQIFTRILDFMIYSSMMMMILTKKLKMSFP